MKLTPLLTLLALVAMYACGSPSDTNTTGTDVGASTAAKANTAQTSASGITLKPKASGEAYADAELLSFTYADSTFNFTLKGQTSYTLGAQTPDAGATMCANSGKGQHIHLILDNKPYLAKYTNEFKAPVQEGDHYMLAFLSRSYHESIKTDQAHLAQSFRIEGGEMKNLEKIEQPMLFYSRPKGTYVGKDAKELLLDFYPVNVALGADYYVKAEINDSTSFTINKWQPYVLSGLPMGTNSVKLSLYSKDGQLVKTPLNPVTRTFVLKEDPAEK